MILDDPTTSEYSLSKSSGRVSVKNKKALYSVLQLLPLKQRQILSLALAGNSSRDIATMLGLKSSGSVRKTIRRAIRNAKKHLRS